MAAHAQIRFLRLNAWPAGMCYDVLWNGSVADNGDGVPPADPEEPVDEDHPLTAAAIEVWPSGKAGDGSGRDGFHPDGWPGNDQAGYGDGEGIDGGEDGFYNDFLTWTTANVLPTLRDGTYTFAVRVEDRYGTRQSEPLATARITVAGRPRPPRHVRFDGWDDEKQELAVSWLHSPDLEN